MSFLVCVSSPAESEEREVEELLPVGESNGEAPAKVVVEEASAMELEVINRCVAGLCRSVGAILVEKNFLESGSLGEGGGGGGGNRIFQLPGHWTED